MQVNIDTINMTSAIPSKSCDHKNQSIPIQIQANRQDHFQQSTILVSMSQNEELIWGNMDSWEPNSYKEEHLNKDLGKILTQLNSTHPFSLFIFIWTHKKRQDRDTRRNDSGMKNKKRTNDH